MKRQIRRNVFETNSSSTHSITMCMKSEYEKYENEELFLFNGWSCYWDINKPVQGHFYTKDEVLNYLKQQHHSSDFDSLENTDEDYFLEECHDYGFYEFGYCSERLASYYEEFTTPNGETIVAFGEYGYDC